MGVIEQVIYFALGCIVTALLALLFMPVLWARALRLSRKRLQLQVPLSMQEILAERDALRARHAVERLRIEQDAVRVRSGKDADMVALGRITVEAARLAEEAEALRKLSEAQRHEIELLTTAVAEHEVASSALRKDLAAAHAGVDTLRSDVDAAEREHARLMNESEGHRTSAAELVARLAEHDDAKAMIERLEAELATAQVERDEQKSSNLGDSLNAEKSRAADRAVTERLHRIEAENSALKRSLEAQEKRQSAGDFEGDDASLRETIHALGLAVATMSRETRDRG